MYSIFGDLANAKHKKMLYRVHRDRGIAVMMLYDYKSVHMDYLEDLVGRLGRRSQDSEEHYQANQSLALVLTMTTDTA